MKVKGIEMGTIGTNCYIISDDNKICAIVDCDGNPQPLFDYIEENQLKPTHILLTHGHFDHIGAVEEVKEKYGCQVYAGAKEKSVLTDPKINHSAFASTPISIEPDVYCQDGDIITVGSMEFKVMDTPGHTEGSVCFVVDRTILSGDTLFCGSCGRTDFPTGDWQTILHSLQILRNLDGDYVVYPGHGPATTLEHERISNPYM